MRFGLFFRSKYKKEEENVKKDSFSILTMVQILR